MEGGYREREDVGKLLQAIEASVVVGALEAEFRMRAGGLAKIVGERLVSETTSWTIRLEMMYFLLHIVDRCAFVAGGKPVRDRVFDAVSDGAIRAMIDTSFHTTATNQGYDIQAFPDLEARSCLKRLNEAQADYGACSSLGLEDSRPNADSVVGRLWGRTGRYLGLGSNLELWALLYPAATEALGKSDLKGKVERACKALR
jgi:hypothetical protein